MRGDALARKRSAREHPEIFLVSGLRRWLGGLIHDEIPRNI